MRLAVVAEAFVNRPLPTLLDWLLEAAPEITARRAWHRWIRAAPTLRPGGVARRSHAPGERWADELRRRGFEVAALNAWGNPLHPDPEVGSAHDRDLRDTIRLAAQLGVERVVALAGCPAAAAGDRPPHFAAGGWLPYLEDIYDAQWEASVAPTGAR